MIIGVIVLVAVNMIWLSVHSKRPYPSSGPDRNALTFISPFQEAVTLTSRFLKGVWFHYFDLVSTGMENDRLLKELEMSLETINRLEEERLANIRLRNLLEFQENADAHGIAAEVIGKDPSPWFKTIIINKGRKDNIGKGMPVVVPQGIVGQVIDATAGYAKVLLVIDQNSAVDALVQNTRARGIIKGEPPGGCILQYVLRRHDLMVGETVIASGLDGVFPKGLRIGRISEIVKQNAGIFQEVVIRPYVDFEKLEEVLVIPVPPKHEFTNP
ncbi:MAG: rod shape-determining protein MreC [Desulfobacteraceae bacterium]|nr:rod shape-determining protein MreC [Desulfobacteraceae bacterium]